MDAYARLCCLLLCSMHDEQTGHMKRSLHVRLTESCLAHALVIGCGWMAAAPPPVLPGA